MQLTVITPDVKENFPCIPMLYFLTFLLQCVCIICNKLRVNFILSALPSPRGPPKGMAMWLGNGVSRVDVPFHAKPWAWEKLGVPAWFIEAANTIQGSLSWAEPALG